MKQSVFSGFQCNYKNIVAYSVFISLFSTIPDFHPAWPSNELSISSK